MDKTHVALDENGLIVHFGTEDECFDIVQTHNLEIQERWEREAEGEEPETPVTEEDNDWQTMPAAIWTGEFPVGDEGEAIAVYRSLVGNHLFGFDASWIENIADDGPVTDPIGGGEVFLLDSMDPEPDGTMKVNKS